MAIISMFYGIIISMYFFDNQQHKLPHIPIAIENANIEYLLLRQKITRHKLIKCVIVML